MKKNRNGCVNVCEKSPERHQGGGEVKDQAQQRGFEKGEEQEHTWDEKE